MKDYYTTETGLHLLKSFAQTEDGRDNNQKEYNRNNHKATIAEAFNASPAILKALYNAEEKRLKGRESRKQSRRDFIGYGSGSSARPYFDGGCGVSVFYKIFESCGYTFEQVASGETFDAYKIFKKSKKGRKITEA